MYTEVFIHPSQGYIAAQHCTDYTTKFQTLLALKH
jgi:hypothetical protein